MMPKKKDAWTAQSRRDLSVSYNKLGGIAEAMRNLKAAKGYYEQDLEISRAIADETRTVSAYDDLAVSYYKLGVIGNYDTSYLQKAHDIWSQLSMQCPSDPELKRRCDIVQNILKELSE